MEKLDFHTATAQKYQTAGESDFYADERWTGSRRKTDIRERKTVRALLEALSVKGAYLDIPSGTGRFLGLLSEFAETVIESDVSPLMLGRARKLATDTGNSGTEENAVPVSYAVTDALNLPFTDGSFDLVFSNRLYHHFDKSENRVKFLSECARVVKKHAIVSFYNSSTILSIRRRLSCALKGREPTRFAVSARTFKTEAGKAGFEVKGIYPIRWAVSPQQYGLLEKL